MSPAKRQSRAGVEAAAAATAGIAFGPSTMLALTFGSVAAAYSNALGVSRSQVMLTVTLLTLTLVAIAPVQGCLIDRLGVRKVVLWSGAAFTAGLALFSVWSLDLLSLYTGYVLLGIAAVGLWPPSYLRVVAGWFDGRLGLALGVANSGIGIGTALLPVLIHFALVSGGWRVAIGALAIIAALIVVVNWFLLTESPDRCPPRNQAQTEHSQESYKGGFLSLLQASPALRWLVLAFFFLGFPTTGLIVTQSMLLSDRGLSATQVTFAMTVFGICLILARIGAGLALDRFSATSIITLTTLGAAVAALILMSDVQVALVYIAVPLIAFALGAEFDVAAYLAKRLIGIDYFGRGYALIYGAFQLAGAIGAPLLALSFERFGSYAPALIAYSVSFGVCVCCFHFRIRGFANA